MDDLLKDILKEYLAEPVSQEEAAAEGDKFTEWMADRIEQNTGKIPEELILIMQTVHNKMKVATPENKATFTKDEEECLSGALHCYILDL